jgi:hypothetical protein
VPVLLFEPFINNFYVFCHQAVTDQKLIYYGQLLSDGLTLKDVLRDLNKGQRVHSLHLVCAPPRGASAYSVASRRLPQTLTPAERAAAAAAAAPTPSPQTQV